MDIKERIKDLTLDQKAKLYFMGLLRKGVIDTLPEDPKAAYIRDMMDKENPRMDPAIRSDFDDPTLENLKEVATELGYLKELERPSFANQKYYDLLNDLRDEGLLKSGISSLQSKFNLSREKAKEIFDEYLEDLKAEQPDAFDFFMKDLNEGDTYEKMAAKGKKSGNLKQGTVRKRLGIKPGEKIPLSTIAKELSRLKKMDKDDDKAGVQLGDKNQKYYKALQLAKTLKTTTNVNENNLNEMQMPEKITFSYTDPGFSFYSMYYLINNDRKKLSSPMEATKFINNLGVDGDVPRRYNETELDKIVRQLETKGIEADHNAFMDVS